MAQNGINYTIHLPADLNERIDRAVASLQTGEYPFLEDFFRGPQGRVTKASLIQKAIAHDLEWVDDEQAAGPAHMPAKEVTDAAPAESK